jgi:transposase
MIRPIRSGTYSITELAELFGVGRSTVYRTIERLRPIRPDPERPFAHLVNQQPPPQA